MKKVKKNIKEKFRDYLKLFWSFFKIGLFTFGGGYAMISFIEKEAVEKNKWLTSDEMMDIIAIAESTPGPISVNAATFVGAKTAGFWGAFFATFGLVLPAFAIICILSLFIFSFNDNKHVNFFFRGLRAGVSVLLLNAVVSFFKNMKKSYMTVSILVLTLIASFVFEVEAIYVLLYFIVLSLIYTFVSRAYVDIRRRKK